MMTEGPGGVRFHFRVPDLDGWAAGATAPTRRRDRTPRGRPPGAGGAGCGCAGTCARSQQGPARRSPDRLRRRRGPRGREEPPARCPKPQASESARCTGTAASSRRRRRVSRGRRIEPAASDAASGSPPRSSAWAVEGAPLRTAAQTPAAVPSRSASRRTFPPFRAIDQRMQDPGYSFTGFTGRSR